jgi:hypothetical protein
MIAAARWQRTTPCPQDVIGEVFRLAEILL